MYNAQLLKRLASKPPVTPTRIERKCGAFGPHFKAQDFDGASIDAVLSLPTGRSAACGRSCPGAKQLETAEGIAVAGRHDPWPKARDQQGQQNGSHLRDVAGGLKITNNAKLRKVGDFWTSENRRAHQTTCNRFAVRHLHTGAYSKMCASVFILCLQNFVV